MPLIRIDYNPNDINEVLTKQLVQELLDFAMKLHSMNEDQISIFTSSYSQVSHSTASAEIEVRAKKKEYGNDPDARRGAQMKEYESFFKNFMRANGISKGIVFTLTLEDWAVSFIAGQDK